MTVKELGWQVADSILVKDCFITIIMVSFWILTYSSKFTVSLFSVARQSHHNMMTEANLATCFGPVIFRAAHTSSNFSKEVEEAQIQKELVAFLIRNRKQLFHWIKKAAIRL